MGIQPLAIAAVAAALLVASIAVDASMNRYVELDVQDDGAFVRVATSEPYTTQARPQPYGEIVVDAGPNDTVTMRVRVDNGYAWGFSETYRAYVNGREVASGTLTAPARGEGEATFTFAASVAWQDFGPRRQPGETSPRTVYPSVEVRAGSEAVYASLTLREASE